VDEDFSRRVLLCMDAKGYSDRNDIEQHELQQVLINVIKAAAEEAGLDRRQWDVQSTGDGELAVLPQDSAEWTVIDEFPAALSGALTVHNSDRRDHARLRMRLAIHQGLVRRADGGYAGQGVVTVSRMVDSAQARQALIACPTADLVVLLSPSLFNEVVLQRHTHLSSKDFREVSIRNKKFHSSAWLYVPGHDVHKLRLDEPAARKEDEKTESNLNATVINNIQEIHGDNPVIGIQNLNRRG